MEYCARCVYPANAKPAIIFDDEGICSGCRYHESRQKINWLERGKLLSEILEEQKRKARERKQPFDCIVPVSGGKDSHYQVHVLKHTFGMNPLLVTFNHGFNTVTGKHNLENLVKKLECDLIRYTVNPGSVQRIARYMTQKVGDVTWHYHAGIRTLPFRVAVQYSIPLIVWGEHGFAELTGMFRLEDMVEFTKWGRQEHDMRGYEATDLITEESGITYPDVHPYVFPDDEDIEKLGVRGIYLGNFYDWDALDHAKQMQALYDFKINQGPRQRTFALYGKTDDHANDVHDYLKYLKFGYGRATDDASIEVRHGRLCREDALELVKLYDHVEPSTLESYLQLLNISKQQFMNWVAPMRDKDIWQQSAAGEWLVKDSVFQHKMGDLEKNAAVALVDPANQTFGENNKDHYWNHKNNVANSSVDENPRIWL